MKEPSRWVFLAGLAHLLADDAGDATVLITVCGRDVALTASVYRVAPSLDVCRLCQRVSVLEVAPPEFPTTPTVF